MNETARYAVVGGGISGLSAAYELTKLAPGATVSLFEASDRLGGKLQTIDFHGAQVERGADSFLDRDGTAVNLCREIGLAEELESPAIFKGAVWDGRRLYELPRPSVMGVPTGIGSIAGSAALTVAEKLRASADLVRMKSLRGPDVSVGTAIREHFGDAVLERFVDPLLAGTRAGDVDEMSLAAALPQIDAAARRDGSIIRGLRQGGQEGSEPPRFLAPRRGMRRIVDSVAAQLSEEFVHLNAAVDRITADGETYKIAFADGREQTVDAVVIAIPAPAAASILGSLNNFAARELAAIGHASVAVIALALPQGTLPDDDSSGFLVPSGAGLGLSAATWWTRKWPHTSSGGTEIVRCFVGRAERHPALDLGDAELVSVAARELGNLLGTTLRPLDSSVMRWDDGLPQYRVGHLDLLERVEVALQEFPGVALAGADYRGSGVPDCIKQGTAAARRVHESVGARGGKVTR